MVKIINTKANPADNILLAQKLRARDLRRNLLFQNWFWFFFNASVMITCIVLKSCHFPDFWPFTDSTSTSPVFSILHIIVPILLSVGLLSQFLLWLSAQSTYPDAEDDQEDLSPINLEEWKHQEQDCDGCARRNTTESIRRKLKVPPGRWHRYTYDRKLGEGVQGWVHQVYYTLCNFWSHWLDSGLN